MIRALGRADVARVADVINDGARAYRGVIPEDRWKDPYMAEEELRREIEAGVRFQGYFDGDALVGVMGAQEVEDVTLIRHAYVRTERQRRGVGGALLRHLLAGTERPVLVGTWAAASWALDFYERHGFRPTDRARTERLLRRYWSIPDRQAETSVVLGDARWWAERGGES